MLIFPQVVQATIGIPVNENAIKSIHTSLHISQ